MAEKENAKYYGDINSAFAERVVKRLWVIIILQLLINVALGYLYIDSITSYETTSAEMAVDNGDGDAYVAGIGDVYYGEGSYQSDDTP